MPISLSLLLELSAGPETLLAVIYMDEFAMLSY